MKKRQRYPGCWEAEQERIRASRRYIPEENAPDFLGNAPNYEKFKGMTPEEVLIMLNID